MLMNFNKTIIQVKVAIAAVRNIRGLPSAQDFQKHGAFIDLFDFLQYCFGFQVIKFQLVFIQKFRNFSIFILCVFQSGRKCGKPERASAFTPC